MPPHSNKSLDYALKPIQMIHQTKNITQDGKTVETVSIPKIKIGNMADKNITKIKEFVQDILKNVLKNNKTTQNQSVDSLIGAPIDSLVHGVPQQTQKLSLIHI